MLPQDYATRIQARFRGGVTRQNQTLANLREGRITSRSAYKSYIMSIYGRFKQRDVFLEPIATFVSSLGIACVALWTSSGDRETVRGGPDAGGSTAVPAALNSVSALRNRRASGFFNFSVSVSCLLYTSPSPRD